jgi:hypothetical protein
MRFKAREHACVTAPNPDAVTDGVCAHAYVSFARCWFAAMAAGG